MKAESVVRARYLDDRDVLPDERRCAAAAWGVLGGDKRAARGAFAAASQARLSTLRSTSCISSAL